MRRGTYGAYKTWGGQSREERFWSKVFKNGTLIYALGTRCWEWMGTKTIAGYGQMTWNKRKVYAHRYSLELAGRPPAPSDVVCHHCDNPSCVRPDHLFIGTAKDNMADASRKGRTLRKELPSKCRRGHELTGDNVYLLRREGFPRPLRRCRACARIRYHASKKNGRFIVDERDYQTKRAAK